jgi:hypothetical protein
MPEQRRYRELLQRINEAHRGLTDAHRKARSKFGASNKTRAAIEKELEAFHAEHKFFYGSAIQPLTKSFLAGEPSGISEVIDLPEVDIAAFRAGYTKEWYCRKLKATELSAGQIERLKVIALNRCMSLQHRREDSELRRLMIRLADQEFLERVRELPVSPNQSVRRRRGLMIKVVLQGRKDLV